MKKDAFFASAYKTRLALSFDDVRLQSGYSDMEPKDVAIESRFSRHIPLHCPIVSAAMDTVTTSPMAIAMARLGGLGIIHKNFSVEEQVAHVKSVKRHLNGRIEEPVCVTKGQTVAAIEMFRQQHDFSFHSFPVVDGNGVLIGLLTQNDFDFNDNASLPVEAVMTPMTELITAPVGTSLQKAYRILRRARKKILPLVDRQGRLRGMFVHSDLKRLVLGNSSIFNVDKEGHLRVGAAIGTGDEELRRAGELIEARCDVLVIDTAHGDSRNVLNTLRRLKREYPHTDVVVGNVSEGASARRLADAGADGIKIGQGPGSICTTRIVAGIGCPQVTAIHNCEKATRSSGIPLCADGGIRNSGDITIALGTGASCVMLGRMLAGTTETPGEIRSTPQGPVKVYRGMGSLGAMQSHRTSRERYRQGEAPTNKLVPEGVESIVPYQGDVDKVLSRMVGGLRSGMGYVGARSIADLHRKADFHLLSVAGLAESHPHNVIITDETNA